MPQQAIQNTLYGGRVEIVFAPASHRYTTKLDGAKVWWPSVTAATGMLDKSRTLIPWAVGLADTFVRQFIETTDGPYSADQLLPIVDEACRQHSILKERAASAGDQVHAYAEQFALAKVNGLALPELPEGLPEQVLNGIHAFLDWNEKHRVNYIAAERLVASVKHGFVGILDAIAEVDGKIYLIDYKTSKAVYDEAWMQTAGYALAHNEEAKAIGKEPVKRRMILHFCKETGEFTSHACKSAKNLRMDAQGFIGALQMKKWHATREKMRKSAY